MSETPEIPVDEETAAEETIEAEETAADETDAPAED